MLESGVWSLMLLMAEDDHFELSAAASEKFSTNDSGSVFISTLLQPISGTAGEVHIIMNQGKF